MWVACGLWLPAAVGGLQPVGAVGCGRPLLRFYNLGGYG